MTKTVFIVEAPKDIYHKEVYISHDGYTNTLESTDGSGVVFYNTEKAAKSANRGHFRGRGTVKMVKITVELV